MEIIKKNQKKIVFGSEADNQMLLSILGSEPRKKLTAEQNDYLNKHGLRRQLNKYYKSKKFDSNTIYSLDSLAEIQSDQFEGNLLGLIFTKSPRKPSDYGQKSGKNSKEVTQEPCVNVNNTWYKYTMRTEIHDRARKCRFKVYVSSKTKLSRPINLLNFLLSGRFLNFESIPGSLDTIGDAVPYFIKLKDSVIDCQRYVAKLTERLVSGQDVTVPRKGFYIDYERSLQAEKNYLNKKEDELQKFREEHNLNK